MTNEIKKGIKEIKKISLTNEEKSGILRNITLYADFHIPVQKSFFSIQRLSFALASLLIIVLAGSSVAYAAEKSLPGDILYPVKVNVMEPVQEALAKTPEAKALVQANLAEKRLKEAENLASKNRLSSSTMMNLNKNYEKHVNQFYSFKETMNKTPERADQIQKTFNTKMDTHVEILEKIQSRSQSYQKDSWNVKNRNSSKKQQIFGENLQQRVQQSF